MNAASHWAATLQQATTWVLPVIFAVTFHEAAHGFVAYRFGDDTAYRAGRMTLNPLSHVDPFGTVLLPALLLLSRRGFCSAMPSRCRSISAGCAIRAATWCWVALAGPAMNVAAGDHLVAAVLRASPWLPAASARWAGTNLDAFDPPQRRAVRLQHAAVSAARRRPGGGRHPAALSGAAAGAGRALRHADPAAGCSSCPMPARSSGFNLLGWLIGVPADALIRFVLQVTGQGG